ncbi:hypothetical protein CHARACLAT_014720 [Characodon lateralis]|uniref:Uncharacterized protein n=1 Tax=Characodon lateralis TaxID=208331 RepID=A0ABU7DB37_9TELE|nr:hypothetical protein [Characodon lateralis]
MKGALYASACQDILKYFTLGFSCRGSFLFQHDCAPVHKARSKKTSLHEIACSPGTPASFCRCVSVCVRVHGCLSCVSLCCPVMDCQPVQVGSPSCPMTAGDRS